MISKDHLLQVLTAGTRAPSGDNSQPWKFVVREDNVEVFVVPEKDQSLYNFNLRGSMVAHGALIENCTIAARTLGYRMDTQLFPDLKNENLVARLAFTPATPEHDPLFDAIAKRNTNRKVYNSTPLTDKERTDLLNSQISSEGHVQLEENRAVIASIAKAASTNERVLFENRHLHDFFFDHVRWTVDEEITHGGGFYFKTLEVGAPFPLFKLLRKWGAMKFFNKLGMSKKIGRENEKVFASARAFGMIVMPGRSARDYVAAGRIFQRIWLTATHLGLALQPMMGVLFLHENIELGKADTFNSDEIARIKDAYQVLRETFHIPQGTGALLFRVGHSNPPSAMASRIPIEQLTIFL